MSWLLGNTVVALLMTAVFLLVGRWLRPAPTVMHALWLLVLLKLVTPPLFTVTVPWSGASAAAEVRTVDLADAARAPGPALAPGPTLAPTVAPTVAAMPVAAPSPSWSTQSLLLLVWGLGGVWFLLRYVAGVVQAERRLRRLPIASHALRDEVAALAARLQVAVPDVRDDRAAACPYVSCFGRTRLVLPARALARTPARGRAAVIAHELAHLRRGDHLLVHAEWALTVLLWWHPLFWFVRAQRRYQAELACDAWAIDSVPDASLDYATLLVQAVATPDHAVAATAVLAVRPAARAAFERRLKMILNERVPCRAPRRWLFSLAPVALTLLGAPALAQGGEGQDVRIEIKVNGRSLDELGPLDRRLLLQKLLGENAPVAAAPTPAKTRVYTVRKGDSLAGIARRELGSATRADEILELNPDLDARRLRIGSKLRMPAA
ncbi:MAG: LysM peptidoglycan-binding domain-containing protein, partial [Planctomycetes bacterium]|nr:LysM peptidoglycan-binding domain-containing protein [Planctomycetota bacterium]